MSLVISSSYVITDTTSGGGVITGNNPVIGWQNLVTISNITTDTEALGFPATNMANPSTNLRWLADPGSPIDEEHVTIAVNTADDVDYIAIARHNLGSSEIPVSVEKSVSGVWSELIADVLLPNDGPAIFRFPPQALEAIRLRLQPGLNVPTIAVVYVGKLLVIQRRLYVGHTPITMGRVTKVTNARSEAGDFLGRIMLGEMTSSAMALKNLTPDWYRTYMDPFVIAAQESPFFVAWRPGDYPAEVGYAWLTDDPQPKNAMGNGMMTVDLSMSGIAR